MPVIDVDCHTPARFEGGWGLIQQLPEMLVFSSDYPHGEGNADPIAFYEPALSSLDEGLRASFLGANMAECFARTGDTLPER
jgi:hypothetical protein